MLGKVSIVLSVLASVMIAIAAPASAEQNKKSVHVTRTVHVNKTVNVNRNVNFHRNLRVTRSVNRSFVVGKTYNGHVWYGHNRHRWHGKWYAYGIGPCWIRFEGEWFWNILACPI